VNADEGMWTFDRFPAASVAKAYGFTPSAAFLVHLRNASVLVVGKCSASFVSPQGLAMTNHHCAMDCIDQLSTPQSNLVESGFYARTLTDERTCPDFELDRLTQIDDITAAVASATSGKVGDVAQRALHRAEAAAQQSCGNDPAVRCTVVSLYHGAVYDLYRYKRYTDVRLAFAPEYGIGEFGGDLDNFRFPRFGYDVSLLRAYENGRPAATPDYLPFSAHGSKAGDLVFVSGHPGRTSRELTVAQVAFTRDARLPVIIPLLSEYRGILEQFGRVSSETNRESKVTLHDVENELKADVDEQRALDDPVFFSSLVSKERRLRAKVAANQALAAEYGSAWTDLEAIQTLRAQLAPRYNAVSLVSSPYWTTLYADAVLLVRSAAERAKPNGERLPEFTDEGIADIEQQLEAKVPVYPDLEELNFSFVLTELRRVLGTDDALVKQYLGNESPEAIARGCVTGTKLGDASVRKALFDGGKAAIEASTDPMILLAKRVDAEARAVGKEYETRIDVPSLAASERIAKARFAVYGTSVDPDATFTLRLSFGTVKGFDQNGIAVPPYTTLAGLFERGTGYAPYALPESWLAAEPKLAMTTPVNLVTTNDIIGGNSGSPLVDTSGRIVGLIFDGNAYALAGNFGYDPNRSRSIAVDSRIILVGLETVYHADRLVSEIQTAAK
jgi:hypothetical protein